MERSPEFPDLQKLTDDYMKQEGMHFKEDLPGQLPENLVDAGKNPNMDIDSFARTFGRASH